MYAKYGECEYCGLIAYLCLNCNGCLNCCKERAKKDSDERDKYGNQK